MDAMNDRIACAWLERNGFKRNARTKSTRYSKPGLLAIVEFGKWGGILHDGKPYWRVRLSGPGGWPRSCWQRCCYSLADMREVNSREGFINK